jgi:wyosine [tRNA(Phe)-imidazoG37] synthetase (radical SAM superfamily)
VHPLSQRKEFVSLRRLEEELNPLREVEADYITFSGMGEPTLAQNLGEAIKLARSMVKFPVAVLTNSSLMPQGDVRSDLSLADVVVAKMDAPDEGLFRRINHPQAQISLEEILRGILLFRGGFGGRLCLQLMFIEENKHCAREMARLARGLSPDEVELNTPLRPSAKRPLSPEEMAQIEREFWGLKVVSVYEAPRPKVRPLNPKETLRRRPEA